MEWVAFLLLNIHFVEQDASGRVFDKRHLLRTSSFIMGHVEGNDIYIPIC